MEIFEILNNARSYYFDTNKPLVAVETSIVVISKMISAVQYINDSNGD